MRWLVASPSHDGVQRPKSVKLVEVPTLAIWSSDARARYAVDGNSSSAQNAEDTEVRYTTRKAARKSQAHARALPGFALLAVGKGAKLVLCRSKPAESAGDFTFFHHLSILVLYSGICRSFDPRMLVL